MDRLDGIGGGSAARSFVSSARRSPERVASADAPGTGHALVPVRPIERGENSPVSSRRPAASFLAHLIATAQREPQTRDRRRAEPAEAAAAYDVTETGRILSGRNFRLSA